jgi:hypothetical protein
MKNMILVISTKYDNSVALKKNPKPNFAVYKLNEKTLHLHIHHSNDYSNSILSKRYFFQ